MKLSKLDLVILISLLGKSTMLEIYENAENSPFIERQDLKLLKGISKHEINFDLFERLLKEYEK